MRAHNDRGREPHPSADLLMWRRPDREAYLEFNGYTEFVYWVNIFRAPYACGAVPIGVHLRRFRNMQLKRPGRVQRRGRYIRRRVTCSYKWRLPSPNQEWREGDRYEDNAVVADLCFSPGRDRL